MKKLWMLIVVAIGIVVVVGLVTRDQRVDVEAKRHAAERAQFVEARETLTAETDQLVKVTKHIAAPLKNLSEEQVASTVALWYLAQGIALAHSPTVTLPEGIATRFKDEIGTVSPGLTRVVDASSIRFACSDEMVACVMALAGCENEDPPRSEEECFESWGPCAEQTMCLMRELEAMRGRINDIFGGLRPPRPIPWPE